MYKALKEKKRNKRERVREKSQGIMKNVNVAYRCHYGSGIPLAPLTRFNLSTNDNDRLRLH